MSGHGPHAAMKRRPPPSSWLREPLGRTAPPRQHSAPGSCTRDSIRPPQFLLCGRSARKSLHCSTWRHRREISRPLRAGVPNVLEAAYVSGRPYGEMGASDAKYGRSRLESAGAACRASSRPPPPSGRLAGRAPHRCQSAESECPVGDHLFGTWSGTSAAD